MTPLFPNQWSVLNVLIQKKMYPQFLIIPAMMITIYCHTPKNNSDVIVTYSGHAEAIEPVPMLKTTTTTTTTTENPVEFIITTTMKKIVHKTKSTTPFYDDDTESVVFIPNDAPVHGNPFSDNEHSDGVRVKDVLNKGLNKGLSIADVLNEKRIVVETEAPKADIVFISGKNGETDNFEEPKKPKHKKNDFSHYEENYRRNYDVPVKDIKPKVNCKRLDCNNTLNSVCGRKMERSQRRYRLFLNECYFNKVNCNFKYAENRFELVPIEKCKNVADHYYTEKPFVYIPHIYIPDPRPVNVIKERKTHENRRTFSSRRSLNIDVDGKFCSHPCPSSCPEQYEPECAMSNKGLKRVFVNHCKLDYNSCSYGAVWHRRPLSECVGMQKADMTRNSAFIGWMQRVGIVDNKGRLKLE